MRYKKKIELRYPIEDTIVIKRKMSNRNEVVRRTVYRLYRTDRPMSAKDSYVGSTSLDLKARKRIHRDYAVHHHCNSKLYRRMREVGVDKWEVEELTHLVCDRDLILEFESVWVDIIKPGTHSLS